MIRDWHREFFFCDTIKYPYFSTVQYLENIFLILLASQGLYFVKFSNVSFRNFANNWQNWLYAELPGSN